MRNLYHLLFGTECKVHLMLKDVSLVLQVCGDPLDRIMWPTYVFYVPQKKVEFLYVSHVFFCFSWFSFML